jgi:hypothetical protein
MGAQITRRAIRYAQERFDLHPFLPVHDEIYFKTTVKDLESDIKCAKECMIQAAFDCLEHPNEKYPIKIGEAEIYWHEPMRYTIHEGAEERFEQIMSLCKKLDEMGPTPPNPLKLNQKKVKKKKPELLIENSELEGFFE